MRLCIYKYLFNFGVNFKVLNLLRKILIVFILLFFDYPEVISVNKKEKRNILHPIHLSYTNVEYFKSENKFKILFKIFTDDFDKIILKKYGFKLEFEKKKEPKHYKKIISKYINENFKIFINNEKISILKYDFHKFKDGEPTLYLNFTYNYKGSIKSATIINTLMTDLYLDQKNLLIFNYKKIQKALKFDKKITSVKISIFN